MEHPIRWILLALVVLALGYLGIGLFVATRLSTPVRQPTEQTIVDEGLDFQEVSFESTDGLDLKGWWIPEGGSSQVVVLVHGLDASKSSQYVLDTAPIYAEAGYSVLTF